MNKAVRINVLVITIVVTLFVFAGLWFTRPGVPNEILQQARQRQSVPLMEVQPPVKKPVAQEVSNTEALAKELLPQLKRELEGPLAASIRSQLLVDQGLVNQLSLSVESMLTAKLQTQLEEALATFRMEMQVSTLSDLQDLNDRLQAEAVAYGSQLQAEAALYKSQLQAEAVAYGSQVQSAVSQELADTKAELVNLVPQLVDAKIPQVVMQVVAQLEANKDSYIAIMREALGPSLQESDLLALYDSYRDQIVLDLVPAMLDGIEQTVKTQVDSYISTMPLVRVPAAPKVSAPAVNVAAQPVVVQEPVKIVAEPVIVPAEPVVIQPAVAPVIVPVEPVVVQPAAAPVAPLVPKTVQPTVTVEAPPVPKQGQPIITVPVFEEKETVVFLDPEVYELKRQEIRTKAIEDVLKRIAP